MPVYLAIDAGGTSTRCALATETEILARVRSGSIKITRVAREQACASLDNLLGEVRSQAGIPLERVAASCVGCSGYSNPTVGGWLRESLSQRVGGELILCGDDEIAMEAAFPGGSGLLVIAGTGSNTIGRTNTGELINVGGWGPRLADQGSGYWIGRQGLRAAMRAYDRGERSLLLESLGRQWKTNGIWGIVERVETFPPPDFAELAPVVNECAEAGDASCVEVLLEGGRLLAADVALAFRKMRQLDPSLGANLGVAFTGSALQSCGILRRQMIDEIRRLLASVQVASEPVDPIDGALWKARRHEHSSEHGMGCISSRDRIAEARLSVRR